MSIGQIPWLRRLEARVVAGVILLVALSLAAILAATTRLVTDRSLERTSADLEAARIAFHRLAAAMAAMMSAGLPELQPDEASQVPSASPTIANAALSCVR